MGSVYLSHLYRILKEGKGAVFFGSGISKIYGKPDWNEMIRELDLRLGSAPDAAKVYSPADLEMIPERFEADFGRKELQNVVTDMLKKPADYQKSRVIQLISQLPANLFYTTNYDNLIDELSDPKKSFIKIINDTTLKSFSNLKGIQLRNYHGSIIDPDSLVITLNDYNIFGRRNPLMEHSLLEHMMNYHFLFLGYSFRDRDFRKIFDDMVHYMGDKRNTHFICMQSVDENEKKFLEKRGFVVIDLSREDFGSGYAMPLEAFLTELVVNTSEEYNIRKFFTGIKEDDAIKGVLGSDVNRKEEYLYYPECDIITGYQIKSLLSKIGCEVDVIADRDAETNLDCIQRDNLILVCSPFGNKVTRRVLKAKGIDANQLFAEEAGVRMIVDNLTKKKYIPDDYLKDAAADRMGRQYKDYALITRIKNPWKDGKHIFLFAGIHYMGTEFIGKFLSEPLNLQKIKYTGDEAHLILEIVYEFEREYKVRYVKYEIM